jgi:hypothetical protein
MMRAFLSRGTPSVFLKKDYHSKWQIDTINNRNKRKGRGKDET